MNAIVGLSGSLLTWDEIAGEGPSDSRELAVRSTYLRATSVLALLWLVITGITTRSVLKP